jgi:SAM-dependent methyltransferase
MTSRIAKALAEQVASNRSAAGHESWFASHRVRLTREIEARVPGDGRGRLALLGIGNGNDVDLAAVAGRFAEVHLVDLDPEAVGRALARLPANLRDKLIVHAPVDLSGVFDRLEAWTHSPPDMASVARESAEAVARVVESLPGPFDVVVSCCLLTQLQLVLLEVVGDQHPRFDALRAAISRIHVHTLARLLRPGGVALLVTDLVTNQTYPLDGLPDNADLTALMTDLLHVGNIIQAAHPGRLSAEIRRDSELKKAFSIRFPVGPWLWHNGPEHTYLVYGLEISARAEAA